MKRYKYIVSGIFFMMLFSGCVTSKIATKEDLYRIGTNTSEEIISVQDDMAMLKEQNSSLRQSLEKQQKQIQDLETKVPAQLKELRGIIEQNALESEKKLQVILDAVSEENKRLAAKIHSLEKPATEEYETGYYHTVQKGDTLSKIATQYGISLEQMMTSNEISDSNKIKVGQKIFVPEKKNR